MRHLATYLVIAGFIAWAIVAYIHVVNDTDPDHFYE